MELLAPCFIHVHLRRHMRKERQAQVVIDKALQLLSQSNDMRESRLCDITPSDTELHHCCSFLAWNSNRQVRSRSQASPKTVGVLPPTSTCNCPLHFSIGSKRDLRFWYAIGSALSTSSSMLTLKKQGTCKTCCENGIVKREQLLLT